MILSTNIGNFKKKFIYTVGRNNTEADKARITLPENYEIQFFNNLLTSYKTDWMNMEALSLVRKFKGVKIMHANAHKCNGSKVRIFIGAKVHWSESAKE